MVIFVSNGPLPTLTYVPDFYKLSEYTARENAKRNDIVLLVEYKPCPSDNVVEKGKVFYQSIDANEKVEKDTVVTIYVSNGELLTTERDDKIELKINSNAKGEFIFKYYIDGTLQDTLTQTKDVALSKNIVWSIRGSGTKTYAIIVENPKTGERKTLVEIKVNFDEDPVKKETISINENVFTELLAEATTTPAPVVEPEPAVTTTTTDPVEPDAED